MRIVHMNEDTLVNAEKVRPFFYGALPVLGFQSALAMQKTDSAK